MRHKQQEIKQTNKTKSIGSYFPNEVITEPHWKSIVSTVASGHKAKQTSNNTRITSFECSIVFTTGKGLNQFYKRYTDVVSNT